MLGSKEVSRRRTRMGKDQTVHHRLAEPDTNPDRPAAISAPPAAGSADAPITPIDPARQDSPHINGDSDEALLAAYRRGDRDSFARLVNRYQRELFHFLMRFLGDRASAEDIFQETFLQVHQSADKFDPQRRFRPWLFTIAANKARDLIRSQSRRSTNPLQARVNPGDEQSGEFIDLLKSAQELPDVPIQQRELREQVRNMVAGMPPHLREILLLSYFHQFSYKQIGEILDIPLGTVKSRLHAAVAFFADRWRQTNQDRFQP